MLTPASPGYRDRALLRLACWAVRRLRARGPLPVPLLVAAGLVQVIDGDPYLETGPGTTIRLPGVLDAPPPRPDAWRRILTGRGSPIRRRRRPGVAVPRPRRCRSPWSRPSVARSGCIRCSPRSSRARPRRARACGDSIARSSSSPSMRRASRPDAAPASRPTLSVYLLGEAPASLGSYSVLITPGLPPKGLPTLKTTRPRPL